MRRAYIAMKHGNWESFKEELWEKKSIDLRTRVKKLGAKEKARRKKCKLRFSLIKKNRAFQKSYLKVGVGKWLRASNDASKNLGSSRSADVSHGDVDIEEKDGRQKEYDPIHGSIWL